MTAFLLKKTGSRWDDVTIDGVSIDDLDKENFDIFRREAIKLKRAAVLLFYRNPECWVTGSYIKIGRFGKGAD